MKPFDIEAAKRGEPICTRDGRKAWFVGMAPNWITTKQPIVAWVHSSTAPDTFTTNGRYYNSEESDDDDLFMASTQQVQYLNVWRNLSGEMGYNLYANETAARESAAFFETERKYTVLVTALPVEWEE